MIALTLTGSSARGWRESLTSISCLILKLSRLLKLQKDLTALPISCGSVISAANIPPDLSNTMVDRLIWITPRAIKKAGVKTIVYPSAGFHVIYSGLNPMMDEAEKFIGSADQILLLGDCTGNNGTIQRTIRSAFFISSQV